MSDRIKDFARRFETRDESAARPLVTSILLNAGLAVAMYFYGKQLLREEPGPDKEQQQPRIIKKT